MNCSKGLNEESLHGGKKLVNNAPVCKLELRSIAHFFSAVEILRDISFSASEGEFISLVGPSGCGKSTLLRIIDGLVKPSSGQIYVNGTPTDSPGADRSVVFQSDSLMPWRTVLQNVLIGLEIQKKINRDSIEHAKDLVKLVGLSGYESFYPRQLSGGMRQRVNLARALAVSPEILLMDEPFAALDAQTREVMQTELLRIWDQQKKTVVFVTHQIEEAVYLSDWIIVLGRNPGRVLKKFKIDFPRPRPLEMKHDAEFVATAQEVWQLLDIKPKEASK